MSCICITHEFFHKLSRGDYLLKNGSFDWVYFLVGEKWKRKCVLGGQFIHFATVGVTWMIYRVGSHWVASQYQIYCMTSNSTLVHLVCSLLNKICACYVVSWFNICWWLMTGKLPAEPSSVDIVVSICSSLEFPGDLLVKEIFRVLKPGGTILIYNSQQSVIGETDKVNVSAFFFPW